jgi:hypothetical protein
MTRVAEAPVSEIVSTPAQQEFYSALQAAAEQALAGIFNQTIYPIQYPAQGDFLWNFQNGNQVFNQGTFDYISANVAPGDADGTVQISSSGEFPNIYIQLLSKLAYALSNADLSAVNAASRNASAQAQTVVSDYQTTFGQITPAQMALAQTAVGAFAVQTLQDYVIAYVLGYQWSGQQAAAKPPADLHANGECAQSAGVASRHAGLGKYGGRRRLQLPQHPAAGQCDSIESAARFLDHCAA